MIKLVAIGDSLTQGFQSGAISRTHLSYPALIAHAIGLDPLEFRVPDFAGEGGLPVNLEALIRRLADRYGERVHPFEFWPAVATVRGLLDDVEDHWERGPGARPSDTGPLHHNLAVWGFEVEDADTLTEAVCRRAVPRPNDDLLKQVPEMAMYRTARRTLNPGFQSPLEGLSQVDAARLLATEGGGIENLIFWLGANNCLGTVTDLDIQWSEDADLHRFAHEREANLWLPEHFEQVYRRVADRVDAIGARFVFVGNVPRVTVPPVTRGVSLGTPERVDGYYEYYTRFWVWDEDFRKDPDKYNKLGREDARRIDATIDAYNAIIAREAQSRGWRLVDLCQALDALAFRRRGGEVTYPFPEKLISALEADDQLRHLVESVNGGKRVRLDTRYLRLDGQGAGKLAAGGLFSLDGVHPTTLGYGIIAHEVLQLMNDVWRENDVETVDLTEAWWERVVAADALVRTPPRNLNHLRDMLGFLSGRGLLRDVIQTFGGRFLR